MMRSMFAGVSGMRSNQMMMDVVADNIANVNTAGYKASRVVFQDTLSQLLKDGSGGSAGLVGSTNPAQVGLGVHVNAVDAIQTQGAIQNTGRNTDLAIQGPGLFVVGVGTSEMYSRSGSLSMDANNQLVDPSGGIMKGWSAAPGTPVDTTVAPTPLSIPATNPDPAATPPGGQLRSFSIGSDGIITASYEGSSAPLKVGQIAMVTFSNPAGLIAAGDGHFRYSTAAGAPPTASSAAKPGSVYGAAGTGGIGSLAAGALEMSNVDLAQEFTNMMIAQRAFQASSKVITTSDELLQELVNLKR